MSERFEELYQEISHCRTVNDYLLMAAMIESSHTEEEITGKDAMVLQKCLDAFCQAMEII